MHRFIKKKNSNFFSKGAGYLNFNLRLLGIKMSLFIPCVPFFLVFALLKFDNPLILFLAVGYFFLVDSFYQSKMEAEFDAWVKKRYKDTSEIESIKQLHNVILKLQKIIGIAAIFIAIGAIIVTWPKHNILIYFKNVMGLALFFISMIFLFHGKIIIDQLMKHTKKPWMFKIYRWLSIFVAVVSLVIIFRW